jgi:dihydrolipoamide dehydrogenase
MNEHSSFEYDLAVIGAGPGGYVAAIHAARSGLRTALIEKGALGGTCLNRGCIPTKAMLHGGEVFRTVESAGRFGILLDEKPRWDLGKLYTYKDKTVRKLRSGVKGLLKYHKVDVITAEARLTGPHAVTCKSEGKSRTLTAADIILAAGSRPFIPPVPGIENIPYWTSDTLLEENRELPESMTIIGGGVIGVESATILNDLGVRVTVVEMMPQLLPRMDSDAAAVLEKELTKQGIRVYTAASVEEVKQNGEEVICRVKVGGETIDVASAALMAAVGRKAAVDNLGLEEAGVKLDKGCVTVDANLLTSVPGIYAIGDITGGWMLAHAASAQALKAVDHILGRENYTNLEIIPACVYTRPEIASVGLTRDEARQRGIETAEGVFPMKADSKAVIIDETAGFIKIITDKATGAVVGAHLIAPRATDIIAEMALAVSAELTVEEVFSTVHPHPTISEAVMEAAHAVENLAVHSLPE